MQIALKPGTYVIAVSGGVDSMALLHALRQKPKLKLVVAHFDHGIREDSHLDRQLVQQYAQTHGLPFVFHEGYLGSGVSEELARKARYDFLHRVRKAANARAILTAHHQNDALETLAHNVFRGTGRRGLTSLKDTKHVKRPLLHISKEQIKDYARANGLHWRDDHTNQNEALTRNYIRHQILPKLTLAQKHELLTHLQTARRVNHAIDNMIAGLLQHESIKHGHPAALSRPTFISLPHAVSREVLAAWLRQNDINRYDRKLLEQLVVAAKTFGIGKAAHVDRDHYLLIKPKELALVYSER